MESAVKVIVIQSHSLGGSLGIHLLIVLISRLCKDSNGCDIRIRVRHACGLTAGDVVFGFRNCLQRTFFHSILDTAIDIPQFGDGQIKVGAVDELRQVRIIGPAPIRLQVLEVINSIWGLGGIKVGIGLWDLGYGKLGGVGAVHQ